MIIDGRIKLAAGAGIARIHERSLILVNGTELPADLIVFATGYGDMNQWAAQLISPEVAENVGRVWGLGSDTKYDPGPWEGELRNMWKPTRQQGLWFHGGKFDAEQALLAVFGDAIEGAKRAARRRGVSGASKPPWQG